jgi:hypothetical protein
MSMNTPPANQPEIDLHARLMQAVWTALDQNAGNRLTEALARGLMQQLALAVPPPAPVHPDNATGDAA